MDNDPKVKVFTQTTTADYEQRVNWVIQGSIAIKVPLDTNNKVIPITCLYKTSHNALYLLAIPDQRLTTSKSKKYKDVMVQIFNQAVWIIKSLPWEILSQTIAARPTQLG